MLITYYYVQIHCISEGVLEYTCYYYGITYWRLFQFEDGHLVVFGLVPLPDPDAG
jgi:hypothetical protein